LADDIRVGMAISNLRSGIFTVREAVSMEKSSIKQLEDAYLKEIHLANNGMSRAVARADPHWPANRLRSYVSSAVLLSTGTIEAAVNEFFVDAVERSDWLQELGESTLRLLAVLWEEWLRDKRVGTLAKVQIALTTTGNKKFDKGKAPYQDADNLFFLRNSLVHFVPEWLSSQKRHKKIEERLRHYSFSPSPFAEKKSGFFPEQCLGADCACWAVQTAYEFVLAFYERMNVDRMVEGWQRMGYYLQRFESWEPIARKEIA